MLRSLVMLLVLTVAADAEADDEWAKGVSSEHQQQANALFAEGNDLFAEQAHAPALEKYKAAIALWDHPLIRFNMAVTEIRLDRLLDAATDLDRALRFGETPFTPELFRLALDYRGLISGRVGDVEATCGQADVQLSLDGKPWFTCPGTQKARMLAGEHVIVAAGPTYIPQSRKVVVAGGTTATEKVTLVAYESAVTLSYRYPRWLPFTVVGTGAGIALAGLAVWFVGRNQMDRYKTDYAAACPHGCRSDDPDRALALLEEERVSARLKGGIGFTMIATGGAATIVGVVMVVLNSKAKRVLPRLEVTPSNGGASATAGWTF